MTRRLRGAYLPVSQVSGAVKVLDLPAWVGCHGGAGVSTLVALTGIGRDCATEWPSPADGETPTVLVCRATAGGSVAAATAIEQWRGQQALRHIRLFGLVVVAAAPKSAPKPVRQRLKLIAGWVTHQWFVGWQDAYLAVDNPAAVGATPDISGLRAHLAALLHGDRP